MNKEKIWGKVSALNIVLNECLLLLKKLVILIDSFILVPV